MKPRTQYAIAFRTFTSLRTMGTFFGFGERLLPVPSECYSCPVLGVPLIKGRIGGHGALAVFCSACVLVSCAKQEGRVPKTTAGLALERPASLDREAWRKEWQEKLPVTASLKKRPRRQEVEFSSYTLRGYVARIEVHNQAGCGLKARGPMRIVEAARPSPPGAKPESVVMAPHGKLTTPNLDDSIGLSEFRDQDEALAENFVNELGNVEVRLRSGLILRSFGVARSLSHIDDEFATDVAFGAAAPGQTLEIRTDPVMAVCMKPDKLAQTWIATPVLSFTVDGRTAEFVYLIGFVPPDGKADGPNPWKLTEAQLLDLTSDGVLPIVVDQKAPAWKRALAARWANERAWPASAAAFVVALGHKEPRLADLRAEAVRGLALVMHAPAFDAVLSLATDKEEQPVARRAAIVALGRFGDRRATPALLETFRNGPVDEAGLAAAALEEIGDPAAVEPLSAALERSERSEAHDEAGAALAKLARPSDVDRLARLARDTRAKGAPSAARALGGIRTPEAHRTLVELCGAGAPKTRAAACAALAEVPGGEAIAALEKALGDASEDVRWSALRALFGRKQRTETLAGLRRALRSPHFDVARSAAQRYFERDASAARGEIRALAGDASVALPTRVAVALAICKDKDAATTDVLLSGLEDKDPNTRTAAAEALGKLREPRAVPLLVALLQDDEVAQAAAFSLGQIGDSAAVPALAAYVRDQGNSGHLRGPAAIALARFSDRVALDVFTSILRSDDESRMTKRAAFALGRVRDPSAIEALIKALRGEDEDTRNAAALALERLTGQELWDDAAAWQTWWKANKAAFPSPPGR